MRFVKWLGIILLVLIVVYLLGPRPAKPKFSTDLPSLPSNPSELVKYVIQQDAHRKIKPDNEARIVWADNTSPAKTEYAVVYLHGFSASQEEGDPVHTEFANSFGCNLYLSRLAEHGIDTTEPLAALTADKLWESAKEALAVGRQIGNKVILMGTSTGGTLALQLAATFPDLVHSLILLSPNIAINDANAWVLNNPWGLQIARMVKGKYNVASDTTSIYRQYWYHRYRMEGAVELQELLESTMRSSLFAKIHQPVLLLYYYEDDDHQDEVVKVSAMQRMFRQLSTPADKKREKALPATRDHVIGSYIKSEDIASVISECKQFAVEILGMPVLEQAPE